MPPRVLFVCVENSCRSQMAEGFARALGEGAVDAHSAGSRPSGRVNETAMELMSEKGIDMGSHGSKGLDALPVGRWDCVVTMGCGDACPRLSARERRDWDLPDPKALPLDEFRKVRDEIEARVGKLVEELNAGEQGGGQVTSRDGISWRWVAASLAIFIGVELLLGGVIGRLVAGRFLGHVGALKLEVIMILLSYFLGGLVIGLMSPRVRILEPAIGAALAVVFTFLITFFTPLVFFRFSMGKAMIGGGIAFVLALAGARIGERFAARIGNRASKDYVDRSSAA
ncbi:arsenate reductase ArsC [Elusimicrobiota bacterium]